MPCGAGRRAALLTRQRKNTKLTATQDTKLTALDAMWRLEPDWNRSYRRLLAYLATGGALDGPANRTGGAADPAFRPGAWLRKQGKARTDGKLTVQQIALLDALPAALAEKQSEGLAEGLVTWSADWTCDACRDGGGTQFEDGTSVDADHDCDRDDGPEIGWEGRAECSACGWSTETDFTDGEYIESNHHCATDQ
ncbi:helicase associated domain-containing protein [Kitasatospora sp. P5_F3]